MASKAGLKLPGEPKKKAKPTGKLVLKPGEVLTRISSKELRQLLGKGYPCYLDFSPPHFQLESDEFLLNCTNIVKE